METFLFLRKATFYKSTGIEPWLVWLSGLSSVLQSKGLLVQFPVRVHAWVAGQVPSGGMQDATTH